MLLECPGEGLLRTVADVECDHQDVGGTVGQRPGGLGQAAGPDVAHDGMAGRRAKGPHDVKAGDAGDLGNFAEGHLRREVAFDEP